MRRETFKKFGLAVSDLYHRYGLWPRICLTCSRVGREAFCSHCRQELEPIAPGCLRCANPQVHPDATECPWCERLGVLPERTLAVYAYRNRGRDAFHWVKYRGYWRLLEPLCSNLESVWETSFGGWKKSALVPIPESFARRWRRQFNPAGQIALRLAKQGYGEVKQILKIRLFQSPMVGMDYKARRKNAKNRFLVRKRGVPDTAILVDDVMTTGATLEAATRALKKAGVKRIGWFTLFRTL